MHIGFYKGVNGAKYKLPYSPAVASNSRYIAALYIVCREEGCRKVRFLVAFHFPLARDTSIFAVVYLEMFQFQLHALVYFW